MINLTTRLLHQLIPLEIDDATVTAGIRRVINHVRASDGGILYDMTALTRTRLRRWARASDVEIDGDLATLADRAADALPVGRVDMRALVGGRADAVYFCAYRNLAAGAWHPGCHRRSAAACPSCEQHGGDISARAVARRPGA